MASLLIKDIPVRLHASLKKQAAVNRRSLNSEAILLLEAAVKSTNKSTKGKKTEEAQADLPPEIMARLEALRFLGDSLAARQVDFAKWKKTIQKSRR